MWSAEELNSILEDQLEMLAADCHQFDKGKESFGLSICHKLRVLLHNTPHSHSILNQLNIESIDFVSSFEDSHTVRLKVDEKNLLPTFGLIKENVTFKGGAFSYFPHFDDSNQIRMNFESWWRHEIVCSHIEKYSLSRKKLVVDFFANQAGGSHLDPNIKKSYIDIYRLTNEVIGWQSFADGLLMKHTASPFLATVRQIAHELFISLSLEQGKLSEFIDNIYCVKLKENHQSEINKFKVQQANMVLNKTGNTYCIKVNQNDEYVATGLSYLKLEEFSDNPFLDYGFILYENGKFSIIVGRSVIKNGSTYANNDEFGLGLRGSENFIIVYLHNGEIIHESIIDIKDGLNIYKIFQNPDRAFGDSKFSYNG